MVADEKLPELQKLVENNAGRRLPGERELTAQLGISRPRLRALLHLLESEGLVQRRQGSGTYALPRQNQSLQRVVLLVDAALKLGDDPFFSLAVETLQSRLQAHGAHCLLHRCREADTLLPRCDAILALGHTALLALEMLTAAEKPGLALFATPDYPAGSHLGVLTLADRAAGAMAADRLRQSGATFVMFFGRGSVPAVQQRLEGARAALSGTSVELHVQECGLNFAAGLEQGLKLHQAEPALQQALRQRQVGLIAANDWLALGLRSGLRQEGAGGPVRAPLVSFDALPITASPQLAIESLQVPLETICEDAVAELARLRRGQPGRRISYDLTWRADS